MSDTTVAGDDLASLLMNSFPELGEEKPTTSVSDEDLLDALSDEEVEEVEETEDDQEDGQEDDQEESEDDQEDDQEVEEPDVLDESYDDVKVKIGDSEVTIQELKKGYLRQSDYTAKTQQLQEAHRALEQNAANIERDVVQLIEDRMNFVKTDVEQRLSQYANVDWKSLASRDPELYTKHKAVYDSLKEDQRKVNEEFKQINARREEQEQARMVEMAKESYAKLRIEIPGWNNELYQSLVANAISNGMPEDVVKSIVDYPTLMMLYKVYQYDNSKSKVKTNVKEVVKETPKVKLKQRAVKAKVDSFDKVDKALKKYRSSDANSREDAATDAILALLK